MKLFAASLLAATATAIKFTDCTNGAFCHAHEQCITKEAGAGRKWGCAPTGSVVCKDPRFSCPESHPTCDFKTAQCANAAGKKIAATTSTTALNKKGVKALKKAHKKKKARKAARKAKKLNHTNTDDDDAGDDGDDDGDDDAGGDDDQGGDDDAGGDDDSAAGPICGVVSGDLPSFCHCADVGGGADAKCSIDFLDVDTVTFEADLEPCNLKGSIGVSESDLGVHWSEGFGLGDSIDIPIPGLSVDIPLVGSIGAVAKASVSGTVTSATFSIGLDACLDYMSNSTKVTGRGSECGSDIPIVGQYLPYTILDETYDFGDVCGPAPAPTTAK